MGEEDLLVPLMPAGIIGGSNLAFRYFVLMLKLAIGPEDLENSFFDFFLIRVCQFRAVSSKYFDAVVLIRIVRSGNHDATRISKPFCEKRDCWSRNHTCVLECGRRTRESLLKVLENPGARHARVLSNKHLAAEFFSDCAAYRNDSIRVQREFSRTSTNSIGPKQFRLHVAHCNRRAGLALYNQRL